MVCQSNFEGLETVNAQPEVAEAMLNRFNWAMEDLAAVAEFLGECSA